MLKHGILGILNYGDMTGYEIMEIFRDSLNYFWTANTSQIYRELGALKDKGYATAIVVQQTGKPDKKIFSITESGREELRRWLRNPDYGNLNNVLCMKTFFTGELSKEENIEVFNNIIANCEESEKRYTAIGSLIGSYKNVVSDPQVSTYWEMTLDYGKRYMKMLQEWAKHNIDILEDVQ